MPEAADEILFTAQETENKSTGAEGGQKGYDFQDLVSIIRILWIVSEQNWGYLNQYHVRANAIASQVDDLHIWRGTKRRHLQIKSETSVTWEEKLRKEFRHDKSAYRNTGFELWVTSEKNKKSLSSNKAKHSLDFVEVRYVDLKFQQAPYTHHIASDRLTWLCLPSDAPSFHHGMWNNIEGVWRRLKSRYSTIEQLLLEASKATGYVIKIPPREPARMDALIAVLRKNIPTFDFSAAGCTLLYWYRNLEGMVPLHLDAEVVIEELISFPPKSEKEFLERVGGKRRGK